MSCSPTKPGDCCKRAPGRLTTLAAIVTDYIATYRPRPWVAFHARQRTVQEARHVAASWRDEGGQVYPHQRRVSRRAKAAAGERIRALDLARVRVFEDLLPRVEAAIGSIPGIGDLAVYDVALRVGASLGVFPERVYLQAGALKGARALGLDARQRSLPMEAFPVEMHEIEPFEVEDVLCLYERALGLVARSRRLAG